MLEATERLVVAQLSLSCLHHSPPSANLMVESLLNVSSPAIPHSLEWVRGESVPSQVLATVCLPKDEKKDPITINGQWHFIRESSWRSRWRVETADTKKRVMSLHDGTLTVADGRTYRLVSPHWWSSSLVCENSAGQVLLRFRRSPPVLGWFWGYPVQVTNESTVSTQDELYPLAVAGSLELFSGRLNAIRVPRGKTPFSVPVVMGVQMRDRSLLPPTGSVGP
jgi:hypothetical protein